MVKDRFLSYLPPRQLLTDWRVIPSAIIYLLGLGGVFLSAMLTGYANPTTVYRYFWPGVFEWGMFAGGFLCCLIAPLIAPAIFRHRMLLLLFAVAGFVVWTIFCVFLYVLFFGVDSSLPPHAKYHFL